jgi:undecaprenyl-diphosphatase
MREPDGYMIEVGQATGLLTGEVAKKRARRSAGRSGRGGPPRRSRSKLSHDDERQPAPLGTRDGGARRRGLRRDRRDPDADARPRLHRCLARSGPLQALGASAAALALAGGSQGRTAAVDGIASIALASTAVNVVLTPLAGRRRPDRAAHAVPLAREVRMPLTTSFPSGHAASAFAFATGVTRAWPTVGIPTHGAAAVVAYSRVHTGVHYPLDVIVGAVVGGALSPVATAWLDRRRGVDRGTPRPRLHRFRPRPTASRRARRHAGRPWPLW